MMNKNLYLTVFLSGIGVFFLTFPACKSSPPPVETVREEAPDDDIWALLDRGESGKAREFFLGKVDVHARDQRGRTPLHAAAENQDSQLAAFFISLGAEIDALDNQERTPLIISTEKQDAATAKVLAAAGASIHHPIPEGTSPARTAIVINGDFLFSLLSAESIQTTDSQGQTILHFAAKAGNVRALDAIVQTGNSLAKRDLQGKTALDLALARPDSQSHAEAAARLILAGAYSENPIFSFFAPAVRSSNYNIRSVDGSAPLHYAAREGYTGFISFLLEKKADVNIKNSSGTTPLHEAARSGNVKAMELLLNNGAMVNAQDAKGNSTLHIAIPPESHQEALSLLFSRGANPNLRDEHGESPLHIAIILNRNPEIIAAMLSGGADTNIRNIEGKTPLYLAVEENRINYIPLLLSFKSDVFAADNAGLTPFEKALRENNPVLPSLITGETALQSDSAGNTILHIVIKNHGGVKISGLVLDHKALVNARNKEGDTSLHLAARQNEEETGELLLSRGADIFAPNAKGESPLYLAFHSPGGLRKWMLNPLTLDARDGLGNSMLHYAAQWRLDSYIPAIVQAGAQTEAANATGEPPLFVAVKYDSASTVRALIAAGASVSSRDSLGNTGLHAAVRWNAPNAAEALILAGIDINNHALNGKTPLHEAIRLSIREIETILIKHGAALEIRDSEGNTPFMEAIMAGFPQTVERLAELGCDPMTRNIRGDTPLHIAVAMERSDLVSLLLNWGASIHAKNAQGMTPFKIALVTSPRMVSTLLTKDRLYIADDGGSSPLHIAIQNKAPLNMVKVIIDLGGRISAINAEGRTPLHLSIDQDDWELAKLLSDAGSDVFLTGENGKCPAEIALSKGREAVRALFSGKAINIRDPSGNTILHYAARTGNSEVISLLIELGANKSIKNIASESPQDIALRWNRNDAAALLR